MSQDPSLIAIVGPGAVGATLAAGLQVAGRENVVLCARRPPGSITVEDHDNRPVTLTARALTDPSELNSPARWVLLTVKAHQTSGAAAWLAALCNEHTTVVVLQNGIEHRESVAPLIGSATLLPAIVWSASEVVRPGYVLASGVPLVSVPDGTPGRAFAELFSGSGVDVQLLDDFASDAWLKLIYNAVAGLQALAGRRSEMFRTPEVRNLASRYAAECALVARAAGAILADDVPQQVAARFARNSPDSGTSILFDRIADRQLEWDARNDVIRRVGERHGIPTPISDVVVPLLIAASNESSSTKPGS
jgi:2-dehydropantoate 2-reductase